MKNRKTKLWQQVDLILWEKWDPIGLNDCPEARNEYHSYIKSVVKMIKNGADSYKLSNHLHHLRTISIGLSPNLDNDKWVATLLIEKNESK